MVSDEEVARKFMALKDSAHKRGLGVPRMITNNKYYSDMNEGEDFSLDFYLKSLDINVELSVKLLSHGSFDAANDTINYPPKFSVLPMAFDSDGEGVQLTKGEIIEILDWLDNDYWAV